MLKLNLLIFSLFSCTIHILAGFPELRFEHYGVRHGLNSYTINSISQDIEGYIWIATSEGLFKYDGLKFEEYQIGFLDENGNIVNYFNSLLSDSIGNIWLLSPSNGLFAIKKHTGKLVNYPLYYYEENKKISIPVNCIYIDRNSTLWVTTPQGLFTFDYKNEKLKKFETPKENVLSGFTISDIKLDLKNNLWLALGENGLIRYSLTNGLLKHFSHHLENKSSLSRFRTNCILVTRHGAIFVGTGGGGLLLFLNDLEGFKHFVPVDGNPASLNVGAINNMVETDDGYIWLGTWDGGLNLFDPSKQQFRSYTHNPKDQYSIGGDRIGQVFQDKYGSVWLSGMGSGLDRYDPLASWFTTLTHISDNEQSLASNLVRCAYKDPYGMLWVGFEGSGLDVVDRNSGRYYHFKKELSVSSQSIVDNVVLSIVEDLNKNIWIGTTGGLSKYNRQGKSFKHFANQYNGQHIQYWSAFRNQKGILWFGTNQGLVMVEPKNESFKWFRSDKGQQGTLSDNGVPAICEDTQGTIWVGTKHGLNKLDTKSMMFDHFYFNSDDSNSISNNSINCMCLTKEGHLWIGTQNGLNRYDLHTREFTRFYKQDGLPDNIIRGIVEDSNGHLWLSTRNGLAKYSPENQSFNVYTSSDGLQGNYYSNGAYFKAEDGEIFFGGVDGLSFFYPERLGINKLPPPINFTRLVIHGKEVTASESGSPLKQVINFTNELTLNYDQNFFSIEFVAMSFTNAGKNQYAYKLEGFDQNWVFCKNQRVAAYTGIPPGNYTFRVKAANNDGVWNEEGRTLSITILPPWWATLWFRITAVIALTGIAYGYYRYRVNALKREKRILESKVAQRTTELSEANAQLEERQEEILSQKEELELQKEELETKNEMIGKAYENMQILSDFGQKISSTLNLDAINKMIYDYVSSLMETQAFGIGIYNEKRKALEFFHFVEDGDVLPYFTKDIDSTNSFSVRCFLHKEEIVIGNLSEEYKQYLSGLPEVQTKRMPVSMIHLPLVVEDRTIGILTINSFRENAYNSNDLNNLRSLASYISIALDNANVYKALHFTNQKVKSSIEYALTIQQSILPLKSELDKYFKSFVLYKPKDVVSGDFYWMQPGEDCVFFAVADCTGHGVPGAFMSLIGTRLLSDIVLEKGIKQPSAILEHLDRELYNTLRQDETTNNDGMDVCLIKLESENLSQNNGFKWKEETGWKVTFCGAMRPLYIISDGSLQQIKGDRRSIGGKRTTRKTSITFVDNILNLKSGAQLYLSTDGFADQNNANHDKMGVLEFESLLLANCQKSLDLQHDTLEQALKAHQGNEEQRDDITVAGILLA